MRYRIRKWNFLLLLLLTTFGIHAQTVEFKAAAPNAVVVGEQFRLTYSVNSEARDIRVAELPDFDILMGPTSSYSSSTMISNGKTVHETSYTFTYILMAKKEGTFNIPPASVKVKNSTYTSNALVVNVLPQDKKTEAEASNSSQQKQANGNETFVVMNLSKRNVYEQEAILVSFKLYTTQAITNITQMKFPEFEGFLVQDIEIPDLGQQKLENYQGKNYSTLLLKQALLYPQRSGTLKIDEGTFDVTIRVRTSQRINSIFDDFFDSYRNVSKSISSKGSSIEVKPLPAGKPASYGGAVGDFKMEATISSDQVKANEAVTVNVKISGTGNVRLVKNPEVTFPNDFDIYDPKVDVNTRTTAAGVTGNKTIEYMAIPRYGGEFEIPAIQFSYFDPKAGTYKTLSAGPYPLRVEAAEGGDAGSPVVSNFTNRESVRYLGQDIRFLKVDGVRFINKEHIFFGSIGYLLSYLIPLLLFIVFFIVYRKQVKANANLALVRTKKANKTAVKRLKVAGKLMKENKKEQFYDEVLRALWGYLSDKLSIPQSNLTKDNVEIELSKYGVSDSLKEEFIEILNTCEFARYAPSQATDAMDKLYEQTVEAIGKMENTIKK